MSSHPAGSWWSGWASAKVPPRFDSKLVPEIYAKEVVLQDLIQEHGAVELSDDYYRVVCAFLKQDMWRNSGIHAHPGFEFGEASAFFRKKMKWLIGQLVKNETLIVSGRLPDTTRACDRVELAWVLKTIHNQIEIFDRGQRRRLNLGLLTDDEFTNLAERGVEPEPDWIND